MLKKALTKAVVWTAVVGGAFVVPGAVAGGPELALAAGATCDYQTPVTTTTTLSTSPPFIQAGSTFSGSASVNAVGTLPSGTLKVMAYPSSGSSYSSNGTQLASKTVTSGDRSVSFSTTTLGGDATYQVVAAYTTEDCHYIDSKSSPSYVSVYKYNTKLEVSDAGSSWTVQVTAPNRTSDSSGPSPTGTVKLTYTQGNKTTTVGPYQVANGTATVPKPTGNPQVTSVTYSGDDYYSGRTTNF